VLDVSGSMVGKGKLAVVKQAMRQLLGILRPEDRVSVVAYADKAQVVLEGVSGREADHIYQTIAQLQPGGGTNGEQGLELAYRVAKRYFVAENNNRIILATDGEFPLSEAVYQLVAQRASDPIRLTVFSFGGANLSNLKALAKEGQGNYENIDGQNALRKLVREAKARKK
jgi:Ca-activated chloride channel homolog